MSVPIITFFNNKGGVGKTSLVYHLAWMLSDIGHQVLACDLDPQSNLTSMFIGEERLEVLWPDKEPRKLSIMLSNHSWKGPGISINPTWSR